MTKMGAAMLIAAITTTLNISLFVSTYTVDIGVWKDIIGCVVNAFFLGVGVTLAVVICRGNDEH